MKELTMDEKKGLLAEVNKLLATIPDYQMAMPVIEMENNDIFFTDGAYIRRLFIDHGEICYDFLGETCEEAIASLAHGSMVSYGYELFPPRRKWSWEKSNSQLNKFESFRAYCDSYIFKNIDQASLTYMITNSPVFDAINQKAAAILQKITAYDVPLVRLMNNNFSSQLVWWYKKEGERWLYCTFEQGEVHTSICAENDDEMVYKTVYDSLANYAQKEFVVFRERNGKNPYRKYDDFMEECLHKVYPDYKYHRPPEYDDRKYEELDADYLKGSSLSSK
ncbi:hypothetical protein L6471_01630 [Segatella bryantii]|uniref:hypothetical protein n=1 Tax=Segatella bryantii TaxID=77095 RepID=UPI001EDB8393|nr:hypothetical protein [Segatella bryantii]UKK75195.1 hypothetical protein L6471_01630 [Segatella bryantii]